MVGLQAFVGARVAVPRVQNEQLMQQRGAGAPVPQYEDRGPGDLRLADAPAEDRLLKPAQESVAKGDKRDRDGDVQAGPVDLETIARQQPEPGEEIAAIPHAGRPFRLFGGFWSS